MKEEELLLLNEILQKYAQITIHKGDQLLYTGPVNGNLTAGDDGMSETHKISLGAFSPQSEESLKVELSLSPNLDHTFESLTGRVDWVFCAQGDELDSEAKSVSSVIPKTGDDAAVIPAICTGILALLAALFLFIWRKYLERYH